jgi:hypothetical protein
MGKPKQDLSVTGGVIHAHVRDPLLASSLKEALARSYDEVLARYACLPGWPAKSQRRHIEPLSGQARPHAQMLYTQDKSVRA